MSKKTRANVKNINIGVDKPVAETDLQSESNTGKSIHVIGGIINLALAKVGAFIWRYEEIESMVNERLNEKLKNVPEENIIPPDPSIVGPSLDALRFSANNEDLREMYANLIASSMDTNTAQNAHPGFVEIIKNMSSLDAKILNSINALNIPVLKLKKKSPGSKGSTTVYEHLIQVGPISADDLSSQSPSSLENLKRLGLIQLMYDSYLVENNAYDILINSTIYKKFDESLKIIDKILEYDRGFVRLTPLGKQFKGTCVISKS